MLELLAQIPTAIDAQTIAAGEKVAEQVAQQLGASEWLGPLAPIALSPFFGLAVLSGISTYGPEWLQQRSGLLGHFSPLNNPFLFWTMAVLALVTSLPRLSKVSKPIALAAEKLETYSSVIILVLVRMLSTSSTGDSSTTEQSLLTAGIASIPLDVFMSIVAACNIIVVNGVKLFFEFLIWLTPIPFVDAVLEATNKTLCAALIGLYCFSPSLAAAIDLMLLVLCALVFGWIYRRLQFYRQLIAGPILAWLLPQWFTQRGNQFTAFLDHRLGGLPRFTRVAVTEHSPSEFSIAASWLWSRLEKQASLTGQESGIVIQRMVLRSAEGTAIHVLHRRWVKGDERHQVDVPSATGNSGNTHRGLQM
jgi:hypothetical protein